MWFKYLNIVFLTICCLILFGCGGSTSPEQGKIVGTVLLEGQIDHSGIEVMLFDSDTVPDEIKLFNNQHPNVGRILRDQDVFDHRLQQVLQTTLTDSSGSYEFLPVPFNEYIIAYRKANWGYNYQFDLQIIQEIVEIEPKTLYPEIQVSSLIDGFYEFLPDRTYRISSETVTSLTSVLKFYPGAKLIFDPQTKLSVNGSLMTFRANDLNTTLTSSHNIYDQQGPTQSNGAVEITSVSNISSISNLRVCLLYDGVINTKSDLSIQSSIFDHNLFGIQSHDVSGFDVSGCVLFSNSNPEGVTVYLSRTMDTLVHDNVFFSNAQSIQHEICAAATISNNVFLSGTKEVQNTYESNCLLTQNVFYNSLVAVVNTGISNLEISYNDFNVGKCIIANETNNWHNTATDGLTKANNNNFRASEVAVEISCVYLTSSGQPITLDFTQNYWDTSSSIDISNMISDSNDYYPPPPGSGWNWGLVDYQPFRSQSVATAGIQ